MMSILKHQGQTEINKTVVLWQQGQQSKKKKEQSDFIKQD